MRRTGILISVIITIIVAVFVAAPGAVGHWPHSVATVHVGDDPYDECVGLLGEDQAAAEWVLVRPPADRLLRSTGLAGLNYCSSEWVTMPRER